MEVEDFRKATRIGSEITIFLNDERRVDGPLTLITPSGYAEIGTGGATRRYPISRIELVRYANYNGEEDAQ